ncbi:MAG: glycosyltransferase, partial [Patescibacteria group bacterium]
ARALLQPGVEDFGMATAEAVACGTPVIALGRGGATEIVEPERTGILYDQLGDEALAEAIRQFIERPKPFNPQVLAASVAHLGRARFKETIYKLVEETIHSRQSNYGTHFARARAQLDSYGSAAARQEAGTAGKTRPDAV